MSKRRVCVDIKNEKVRVRHQLYDDVEWKNGDFSFTNLREVNLWDWFPIHKDHTVCLEPEEDYFFETGNMDSIRGFNHV